MLRRRGIRIAAEIDTSGGESVEIDGAERVVRDPPPAKRGVAVSLGHRSHVSAVPARLYVVLGDGMACEGKRRRG